MMFNCSVDNILTPYSEYYNKGTFKMLIEDVFAILDEKEA